MNSFKFFIFVSVSLFLMVGCEEEDVEIHWIEFTDYDKANELANWTAEVISNGEFTHLKGKHSVMQVKELKQQESSSLYYKMKIGLLLFNLFLL